MKKVDISGLERLIGNYERAGSCGCNYQCGCDDLSASGAARALKALITEDKEFGMITALEAKERIDKIAEVESVQWLEKAEKSIEASILKKQYFATMSYSPAVFDIVKRKLEEYGYRVSLRSGGCGSPDTVKIEWS